jgi:hypothetical protein
MLKDIVAVQPLTRYRLKLQFEDGVEGTVDVSKLVPLTGVFAPLRKRREFLGVRVNTELGTVVWPCGADLDPDVLYAVVTGQPMPSFAPTGKNRKGRRRPATTP